MKKKIYEGKAKVIYKGNEPKTLIQYFKDDATAFNNKKKATIPGKGVLNNFISELLMNRLSEINIPTHFIKRINMREQLIHQLEIIPIEVVVRNISTGSLVKRLGIEEGKILPRPITEFYLKNDKLGDPLISEEHIITFEWASANELEEIMSLSSRINDFLIGFFLSQKIRLVDFKLEFGRYWDQDEQIIMLADEISPDNCRLWDIKTNKKLDKDRFRHDLGDVDKAYKEVAYRLGVLSEEEFKKVIKNDF
ncbi:MAG: phosphoribosylaminoimidazolesuccinocarboxamide synthase [Rickettsiales bacterium]|nr:phosphoribosylaminoimidazolesuccinocarboxamide synthase [Rickettsiales bacterium]|tara:strand:- start:836 stop:1588 length:753 start_codon:yes stop_codon:yes gene_type:complete